MTGKSVKLPLSDKRLKICAGFLLDRYGTDFDVELFVVPSCEDFVQFPLKFSNFRLYVGKVVERLFKAIATDYGT